MKRIKALSIVLPIFLILASCSKNKNGWDNYNIKGEVKTIRESSYNAVERFGKVEKGDEARRGKTLNFDSNGKLTEEDIYIGVSLSAKVIHHYDEQNKGIESLIYNASGSLDSKAIYHYDNKNNNLDVIYYNSDGDFDYKFSYKYNDKGFNTEEYLYVDEVNYSYKITYKYDNKGKRIEKVKYKPSTSFQIRETYVNDDKGNNIQTFMYDSDGICFAKFTYKYEYDEKDNWIKQITYKDKKPVELTEREIEYYN